MCSLSLPFLKTPARGFSGTELMALLLSRNPLKPLVGTEIADALNSALSKASAALPPQGHEYVRAMESIFSVGLGPHKKYAAHRATIDLISQEIDKRRTVQLRYFSAARGGAGSSSRLARRPPFNLAHAGLDVLQLSYIQQVLRSAARSLSRRRRIIKESLSNGPIGDRSGWTPVQSIAGISGGPMVRHFPNNARLMHQQLSYRVGR